MKLYGKRRQVNRAYESIRMMSQRFHPKPNAQVRMALLCVCLNNGAWEKAQEVLGQMKSLLGGVEATVYVTLRSGCMRSGQLEHAACLAEEAYGLVGPRRMVHRQTIDIDDLERLLQAINKQGLTDKLCMPLIVGLKAAEVLILWTLLYNGANHVHRLCGASFACDLLRGLTR